MPDLLLELFSEEIPARMQARAAADLDRLMTARLTEAGLAPGDRRFFAGPRRLTYVAEGLPERQGDTREERKGPRVGAPEKAVQGFLRGAGLDSVEQAQTREDKKGAFYVAVIERKGRATAEVVAEAVPALIRDFPWPKSMRWGGPEATLSWVRPLRRVLCTLGGEVVPFTVTNGAYEVASGRTTEGHRFMAPGVVEAPDFEAYQAALAERHVILDAEERKRRILEGARAHCEAEGLALVEDDGLLAETAGLAEWPVPRLGSFDPKFLALPDEVLTASMKGHQKYFSVRDPKSGRLAPRFVTVANVEPEDGGAAMMVGYERVLTARLSDGLFLFEQDRKTKLEEHAKRLSGVTFFEGLGTIADKVERVAALAREIAPEVGADPGLAEKAARLAKADLVTEMVGEFPELQGVMGRYYALGEGIEPEVADAVRDHYKPAGQGDEVPTAPVSVALALADKLATLAMFWSIGKTPTGSSDPFALRRMALGVVQIVLQNDVRMGVTDDPDLRAFFHDRLTVYLRDKGHRHDRVAAALRPQEDDLARAVALFNALNAFLSTEDGGDLTVAYKRAANILRAEAKKGTEPAADVDPSLFTQGEERTLYEELADADADATRALNEERFEDAMSALSRLRGPLDAYFDRVTVVTDDPESTANRLALLRRIAGACERVADFGELEG